MERSMDFSVNNENIGEIRMISPGQKVNILSSFFLAELKEILLDLEKRKDPLRALVFKSSKKNIFIAGADIGEIEGIQSVNEALEKAEEGTLVVNLIAGLPFPTIAAIDGACLGGGLELALACDYRIASLNPKTRLGFPEVSLGIIPGFGGTVRAPRLVGLTKALTLILTGKPVDAKRALKMGLVDDCAEPAFMEEKIKGFIGLIETDKGLRGVLKRRAKRPFIEKIPFGKCIIYRSALKGIKKKGGLHYPAPFEAVRVIKKNFKRPLKKALAIEREAFSGLAVSRVCRNLTGLFFIKEKAFKVHFETPPTEVTSAGVIGAGVMGGGISWLFSNNLIPVRMKDIAPAALEKGYSAVFKIYSKLKALKKIRAHEMNLKLHKVTGTLNYRGFKKADLVIEAVVENMEVKKKVLAELETHLRLDTVIATNTSSLSVTEMAGGLKHPERFGGLHFFNPVNRMPLVEIIPGAGSSSETVSTLFNAALKMKKVPVIVKDGPGFLVNRLLLPYLNEAGFMADEGTTGPAIDRVLKEFGMPMGPFALLDEIGIDVAWKVALILSKAFSDRMEAASLLKTMYETGRLFGKKSGKGFYIHGKARKRWNREVSDFIPYAGGIKPLAPGRIVDRLLLIMINEAALAMEEGIIKDPALLDLAMIMGTGFPPFRGGLLKYADSLGLDVVVEKLKELADCYGKRFEPAPGLLEKARRGKGFYD